MYFENLLATHHVVAKNEYFFDKTINQSHDHELEVLKRLYFFMSVLFINLMIALFKWIIAIHFIWCLQPSWLGIKNETKLNLMIHELKVLRCLIFLIVDALKHIWIVTNAMSHDYLSG